MLSDSTNDRLLELLNNRAEEKEKNMKKEHDPMVLATTKIVVGGMTYPVDTVDYLQTPFEYPQIKITATLDPFHAQIVPLTINKPLTITNVIFNPPATIVFWSDKTKTVVKADYEDYDPEKGIAMAVSRKMLGNNKREYYNIFRHWLKRYEKQYPEGGPNIDDFFVDGEWDGNFANY